MAKYKLLNEDTMKNLIDFLDEVQFDAATEGDVESMHKVNFCGWAITELLNSPEAYIKPNKPKKKSRDDYVDETFIDWNLPEMSDEDYEKLVDTFDNFLRGWEEEYYKNNREELLAYGKKYRQENVKKLLAYQKKYRKKNREKLNADKRALTAMHPIGLIKIIED